MPESDFLVFIAPAEFAQGKGNYSKGNQENIGRNKTAFQIIINIVEALN